MQRETLLVPRGPGGVPAALRRTPPPRRCHPVRTACAGPPAAGRDSDGEAEQCRGFPAAPVPAPHSPPAPGGGEPGLTPRYPALGLRTPTEPTGGLAPPLSLSMDAGAAAGAGPMLFTLGAGGDTATGRPVSPWGKTSRDGSALAGLWTLPPCQVMVRPRDRARFWGDMKTKIEEMADCDLAQRPPEGRGELPSPVGVAGSARSDGVGVPSSQASAPAPMEFSGQDWADADTFPGGYRHSLCFEVHLVTPIRLCCSKP